MVVAVSAKRLPLAWHSEALPPGHLRFDSCRLQPDNCHYQLR
jgi:hypothetical protein